MKRIRRFTRLSYFRLGLAVGAAWLLAGPSDRLGVLAQGGNPISVENALTGDVGWDVTGSGDSTIQGFATDISINTGGTVNFKINTPSAAYTIDIYRMGYYGGAGARKVATVAPSVALPQSQPACLSDPTTGLVDCGNWAVSASWTATGAVSGIYFAKLTRTDTGGASHIFFVVRDDARVADIVVQTSDTTWQAYNRYGGGSLYCGGPLSNAGTAYFSACPNRAAKVSYNRPLDTRDLNPQSFVFNAEYPMVRWLEANGYNVKYWAGIDTDRRGADLSNPSLKPKVFMSSGHDEYWSGDQRIRVEAARNNGVNLAFFSGNEVYWKTRYEASIDGTSTAYRTLVSYKETLAGLKIDPALDGAGNPIWTGTWRDPRFSPPADGGRQENALTGQIWTVNSGNSAISIPASMANHRFWRNTRVAALTTGSTALTPESLGYEWDEDLDNGDRPTGLMHLSATTVSGVEKIIDYGSTVAIGTATHNMTLYRHSSGALVFGAGTVQYAWTLDANHDRGAPEAHVPDIAGQQAVVNLLADMGSQPATLQSGLVSTTGSTDSLAPSSAVTSPAPGATVSSGDRVTIAGTAVDNGGGSIGSVEVSVDGGATWHVAVGTAAWTYDWGPGTVGPVTIRSRAIDDSGNMESAGSGVTVNVVAGSCPCSTIWRPSTVPVLPSASDNSAVELGVKFQSDVDGFITAIRFYKGPANTGTHIGNLWTLNGTLLATATFTGETGSGWQQGNFPSPVHIAANTTYVASYHTNVGGYSSDSLYFATAGVNSPPLHALPSNSSGGNGLYRYGVSGFPSNTFNATNYYVDVVFAESVIDSSGPVISQIKANAIDGSHAVVTWKTDEEANSLLEYSTDPGLPPGDTVSVSDAAFVTNHTISLSGLTPNATYFIRITSADHMGNMTLALAPSFTLPGPTLHDTATVDFSAGTQSGTHVSQTGDGEVILAPTVASEFSGTTLPSGWIEVPFSTSGYSVVGDGALLVDGARVASCVTDGSGECQVETPEATPSAVFTPPHSLEFAASFSGDRFQNAGLAQTLWSGSEPWATFSTTDSGTMVARSNTGSGITETPLGPGFLGAEHRYRIDWQASSVLYYVDGALVATHNVAVPGPLRPVAASDFNAFGGSIAVDWMRMSPYAATGTFHSRVFDALSSVSWASMYWTASTPPGTSIAMSVRTGDTPVPDGSWSAFTPVAAPGPFSGASRYIQYRADLTTADTAITPELQDVIVSTDHAPVAVNDSGATLISTSKIFPATGPTSLKFNDTDSDTPAAQLSVAAVTQPAHGTVTLNGNGSVTYTPTTGFSGNDSFTYQITDGLLLSNSATVSMSVGGYPTANPETVSVSEDSGANGINVLANDVHTDSSQTLTIIDVTQGAHGAVAIVGGGTSVTYTPSAGYVGADSFNYTISDTASVTSSSTVTVTVNPNQAPSFVKGADQAALEDAGGQSVSGWATSISAGAGETQTVDFIVSNNNNPLFSAQPAVAANGTLTYTPAANANGSATVTVRIHDNGGTASGGVDTSAPQTFTITVAAVNDAPSFVKGANESVQKNTGAHTVAGWATSLSAGPSDESGQGLSFTTSNTNNALFSAQPAVASNGTLSYTLASGQAGSATVTVRIVDTGGTANGGVDTSAPQTFVIAVNDPPPVAICQSVTATATVLGTAIVNINNGSNDPDGGPVTLAQVPPGPYLPGTNSVVLNVTDSASQVSSCSATVTVNAFAQGASFGFEESSANTVTDVSGNGNNGTFSGASAPTRTTAGRFGKAMVFDGVNDLISVADANSLDFTSAMTLMAWVKPNTQTGWRNVMLKQNGSDLVYGMYSNNVSGTGQPAGYVKIGSTMKSGAALDSAISGQWMHVAVTYGGGSLKVYVNGNLQRTVAATGNMAATAGVFTIGGNNVWLDEFFSGTIDEVRIMNVALAITDIRTLMRTPVVPGSVAPATDTTNLIAAYNFDSGTAADVTGKGHTGTLANVTTAAGMFGQALAFNGTSSIVTVADANDLDFTTGMTIEAYVRPASVSGWRSLIMKERPGGLSYALYSSDELQHPATFVNIGGGDRDARGTEALPLNTWSHVVATYNKTDGRVRIFVDGLERDNRAYTGDITVSTGALSMGGNSIWGEYFNGQLDNVRLYNRALNIAEIQTNQSAPVQ